MMHCLPVRQQTAMCALVAALFGLAGCGGGGSSDGVAKLSGATNTTLRVEVTDTENDALAYQWRVTAGTIENRNNRETVWSLPDGGGLHFAYVLVSDGKGGYIEQQYAVSTDAFKIPVPFVAPIAYVPPSVTAADEFDGASIRLRLRAGFDTNFADPAGGTKLRYVFLPGVQVRVFKSGTNEQVFSGVTDLGGELTVPRLPKDQDFDLRCSTGEGVQLSGCGSLRGSGDVPAQTLVQAVTPPNQRNLRLFGHVGFSDGGVCGVENAFFGLQSSASVQLQQGDGTTLTPAVKVNRFGDYALDAPVLVNASDLKLRVVCESYAVTLNVPVPASGFTHTASVELSHMIPNSRPQMVKMVANGPDGNVRGKMVVPISGAYSNVLPRADHFLTYKGADSRLSACNYYRSFGAVRECDAQGNMTGAISLDDWKREHKFSPYRGSNEEVSATYVNQRDLNLVRRMLATKTTTSSGADKVAFVVCNHPGPEGDTQRETDLVIDTALGDEKQVACVAMEYSPTAGRSGDTPFTKFLTFGPDGKLVLSVNLDGRGEKYMPGACVACHGGMRYMGSFPEKGNPSPDLNANFLPFDTGNYLFSSRDLLTESSQSPALNALNKLVLQTAPTTATQALIGGWYKNGSVVLDKHYVPDPWVNLEATQPGASRFYREVVGTSCRTCHAAVRDDFDWDSPSKLLGRKGLPHVCGGKPDLHLNASMPNALISLDRLQVKLRVDATLADLTTKFLGCVEAEPDPVYPKR